MHNLAYDRISTESREELLPKKCFAVAQLGVHEQVLSPCNQPSLESHAINAKTLFSVLSAPPGTNRDTSPRSRPSPGRPYQLAFRGRLADVMSHLTSYP